MSRTTSALGVFNAREQRSIVDAYMDRVAANLREKLMPKAEELVDEAVKAAVDDIRAVFAQRNDALHAGFLIDLHIHKGAKA